MILRKCKCGTVATNLEELELFSKSKTCNYGRRNLCKKCSSLRARESKGYTTPAHKKPEGAYVDGASQVRYSRYGVTQLDFEVMVEKAGGCCEICGSTDRLCVDHCHNSGEVRGILCWHCNIGIGHLNDDIKRLNNAVVYLSTHKKDEEKND